MPASTPTFDVNGIALVMARLIIKGDRGMRPFIVCICNCNTREPYPRILFIRQPLRSGAQGGASPRRFYEALPGCQS